MGGKLTAILVLAATSGAIGAVSMNAYPRFWDGGDVLTVDLVLTNMGITNPQALAGGATGVWGTSFWIQSNAESAGKIQLTGRTINAAVSITDPTTANAAIPLPLTLQATRNVKDLGSTASVEPLPLGSRIVYQTLTFTAIEPLPPTWQIMFVQASYNDDMGSNWPFDPPSNLTIPEPGSVFLLVMSLIVLANRRRV